jgi:hypothetical protein
MVGLRIGQSRDCHVTITNCLYLEDTTFGRNLVKGGIQRLQQRKHLHGLSHRTPSRKAGNVTKHYRTMSKQISNWFRLNPIGPRGTPRVDVILEP